MEKPSEDVRCPRCGKVMVYVEDVVARLEGKVWTLSKWRCPVGHVSYVLEDEVWDGGAV